MNDFKFGRTYSPIEFIDMDFKSLYLSNPCGELFLITGNQPRPQEDRMVLLRYDLTRDKRNNPLNLISIYDFTVSMEKLDTASIVVFVDNNGSAKILKNRYGPEK